MIVVDSLYIINYIYKNTHALYKMFIKKALNIYMVCMYTSYIYKLKNLNKHRLKNEPFPRCKQFC